eukprot:TRINITY_DN3567_c0_g2_i3.p4 TRINITY_DN3567_c0_g2~~TRINITY_DN3567_c0_g2_i3.p4  ORF type:complete len:100 (-),score=0.89 TRINITY_DN3567_c0_g2_i3:313-612(-)
MYICANVYYYFSLSSHVSIPMPHSPSVTFWRLCRFFFALSDFILTFSVQDMLSSLYTSFSFIKFLFFVEFANHSRSLSLSVFCMRILSFVPSLCNSKEK